MTCSWDHDFIIGAAIFLSINFMNTANVDKDKTTWVKNKRFDNPCTECLILFYDIKKFTSM